MNQVIKTDDFNFSEIEKYIIHNHIKKIEEEHECNDLLGLYLDISKETNKAGKASIIFDYAKLIEEQLHLYSMWDAYQYAKNHHGSFNTILMGYLHTVAEKTELHSLSVRLQSLFNEIADLLGDKRELISDFTVIYRNVNGIAEQNIEKAITFGIQSKLSISLIKQC